MNSQIPEKLKQFACFVHHVNDRPDTNTQGNTDILLACVVNATGAAVRVDQPTEDRNATIHCDIQFGSYIGRALSMVREWYVAEDCDCMGCSWSLFLEDIGFEVVHQDREEA